ncbi:prenyltransferase [Marinobacterium rhizophilum]|uniref:prenyltransferase n=1 Tax=Marinobacterium rhizophilum TaxID=420402 RepID=UPI000371C5FC|nr:prenyltransferase [Marinobacterium rhizophilum]
MTADTNRSPAEPSVESLGGSGLSSLLRRLLLATRPMFLTASILPVLVGTSWGYRVGGTLDWTALALALAAIVLIHAAANVLNDVFDDLGGTDRHNDERIFPFTGGSRFIQNGVMSVRQMALWGAFLLILGIVFGLGLVVHSGMLVLLFGVAGVALGLLYSIPPMQLNARGLGELAVGAGFGILPVTGAAWLQSGISVVGALVLSLPIACWIMAILLMNEVPDLKADQAAGKHTLVVRLGLNRTRWLYLLLQVLALAILAVAVSLGMLQSATWLIPGIFLLLAAIVAAFGVGAVTARLKRSIQLTLMIHMLGGLWLIAWILL